MSPFFSIILPTLNGEAALRACLDSVAAQTFTDFQLVLVDGGSTDGTVDVAARYAPALGPRLVVDRGKDDGVYHAMNRGVGLTTGGWLYFLGADDALAAPETLAQVAAFIAEHHDSHLVYGDVVLRSTGARDGGEFHIDRLLFDRNLCHQAVFYRRELFTGIGPYNPRYRIWADWDFNIRCFANPALVARHMDLVVANYNDTGGLSTREDPELKPRLPVFLLAARQPTFGEKLEDFARKLLPGRGKPSK